MTGESGVLAIGEVNADHSIPNVTEEDRLAEYGKCGVLQFGDNNLRNGGS